MYITVKGFIQSIIQILKIIIYMRNWKYIFNETQVISPVKYLQSSLILIRRAAGMTLPPCGSILLKNKIEFLYPVHSSERLFFAHHFIMLSPAFWSFLPIFSSS